MSKMTVKTQERGPFVKIMISVMRIEDNFSEMTTQPINVDNKAVVIVKLKAVLQPTDHLGYNVQFKKSDKANNYSVLLNINSGEYNKQFFCSNEWVEAPQLQKAKDHFIDIVGYHHFRSRSVSYFIEMNINVNFIKPVSSTYNELYEDKEFTDFTLKVANGTVPVHKSILFVQSEMFRAMLRGKWKETDEDSITMPGVSVQTLQHLKDYMYLGILPEEGLESLLLLAKRYLMDKLIDDCIDKLSKSVKPETFNALIEFAMQNNMPELVRGLFLRIPEDVVNGISQLYNNEENTDDAK